MSWQAECSTFLSASLVRPFALAAAAWLLLPVLRVGHPSSRHAVWTAVLGGMLVLPVASMMAPHWKVRVLPGVAGAQAIGGVPAGSRIGETAGAEAATSRFGRPRIEMLVPWCYVAGFFGMLIYRATGVALMWRVRSRSRRLRWELLRESDDVQAPVVMGMLRPVVILPAGWRDWSANTRRAVLFHEFAHLRRHDGLVSALAQLVKCVFWFHPLAWWLSRKTAELACDAAVLERTHDPAGYSRILLEFADAVRSAGHRAALTGLAMAAPSGMSRRIDQVFELASGRQRRLARPGLVLALTGIPAIGLAVTLGLGERSVTPPAAVAEVVSDEPAQAAPSPAPGRALGKPQTGAVYLNGLGTAAPFSTVNVKAQIDGQLVSVNFKEGDLVKGGQTLAAVDSVVYQIQLTQAEGQLAADEALLKNADVDPAREQLQARIKADEAMVAGAKLRLGRTRIIAPISGLAGPRQVEPGNMVNAADSTPIVVITQLQPIAVLFTIPEDKLPEVLARLREPGSPTVEAWNRDSSAKIATGKLTAVDNQIDPVTGTAKLKAVFDNKDGALAPGQFVNLRVLLRSAR